MKWLSHRRQCCPHKMLRLLPPAFPKTMHSNRFKVIKGIDGGGERSHRSLSPSANRLAQLAGPTHPPQTRRSHPHCPTARREVPRAVAAPSPALLVSKSTAVDSVTTWVLRLRRDGHIGSRVGLCGGGAGRRRCAGTNARAGELVAWSGSSWRARPQVQSKCRRPNLSEEQRADATATTSDGRGCDG